MSIENFLDENNQPIVTIKKGRNSGKLTKGYLSKQRFKKALRVVPTKNSSEEHQKKAVIGGSRLCRMLCGNGFLPRSRLLNIALTQF